MENVEKSSSIKDQNSTKQNENNAQPNQSDLASQGQALQGDQAPLAEEMHIKPKNKLPVLKFLVAGVIILITLLAFGLISYLLMSQNKSIQVTETEEAFPASNAAVTDTTTDWKTYRITAVGMEFKIPKELQKYGELEEKIRPGGDTGTKLSMQLIKDPPSIKDENFDQSLLYVFELGATSINFSEGRGSDFTDYRGFSKKDGKYFVKFVNSQELEIQKNLVSEIPNEYDVEIIKIKGANTEPDDAEGIPEFPETGSPGEGWYGALINTKDSTYTGLALEIRTNEITEEKFEQILSTFRFTEASEDEINPTPVDESSSRYVCPSQKSINCMPTIGRAQPMCGNDYLSWISKNCPGVNVLH